MNIIRIIFWITFLSTILFILLKAGGYLYISWWWILATIFGALVIFGTAIVALYVVLFLIQEDEDE